MRAYYDRPPAVAGSATSMAAAESMTRHTPQLRLRVLKLIEAYPRTCDEIELALGLRHQTASARVRELAQLGAIVASGDKARTRSGRWANIWRVAPRRQP